ncbi:5759_t:CDS:2, partial [Cetraspora pellucida]
MSIQQMPDNVILFYKEKDVHYQGEKDYYGFTNFSSHKITTRGLPRLLIGDGEVDQKGNVNEELIKEVCNQPDPMAAKNFAGSKNGFYNGGNWLGKILMEIRDELALNQPKTDSNSPPQNPPFDTSQPNVSNGGSNSPDTNQNSPNNQSPNQEEQNNPNDNGPTPNPPTNGDNHDPEKNNDSPLPNSDADIPPIDMSGINNAATTEQAQQEARTQIQQLFANSKELTTQSEIAAFVKEIEKEIREKYQTQQNKNNDSFSDSSNKNKIS